MDWQLAITRNRDALIIIVMALMASLGLTKGGTLTTLPFHLYRKALLILRPAEAALRRLIVIAAHDLMQHGFNLSPRGEVVRRTGEGVLGTRKDALNRSQARSFLLIEPLKTFNTELPDFTNFSKTGEETTTRIPAASLGRRLLALHNALNTIPKQARRLCRWYAARDLALSQNQPHRLSPTRPGLPPGYQRRPKQEIEIILSECHGLAHYAYEQCDSS